MAGVVALFRHHLHLSPWRPTEVLSMHSPHSCSPHAFSTNRFSSPASEADLSTFYLQAPQVVSKLLKHTCSKGYDKDGSVETELLVG